MPKHEFGIMQQPPILNKRYDDYNPEKYNCIIVDDDLIGSVASIFNEQCYWHTLVRPEKGLAYYGVTLIPPKSAGKFAELLEKYPSLSELKSLLLCAENQNKFVIHFGI